MPCTSCRAIKPAAVAVLGAWLAIASTAAGAQSTAHVQVIDDAVTGKALVGRFDYVGKWQQVSGKHDGRTNGTSTRSTHVGDVAILNFSGTRVRIYGIRGRSGGRAGIALDGASTGGVPVDFYSPRFEPHALIYQSPVLPSVVHNVTVVVWGTRNVHGRYYYVNIDGAEVEN